jgi:hypothetical protein
MRVFCFHSPLEDEASSSTTIPIETQGNFTEILNICCGPGEVRQHSAVHSASCFGPTPSFGGHLLCGSRFDGSFVEVVWTFDSDLGVEQARL